MATTKVKARKLKKPTVTVDAEAMNGIIEKLEHMRDDPPDMNADVHFMYTNHVEKLQAAAGEILAVLDPDRIEPEEKPPHA